VLEKIVGHLYRVFDSNNDGYIDFVELLVVESLLRDGSPEEKLGNMFKFFDQNGDGMISKSEMKRVVKDLYVCLKHQEPEAESEAVIAKTVFTEMDADRDGRITKEEFISAVLAEKDISVMLNNVIFDQLFRMDDED
jgi:Ca2+-binding EF-hand superfamily protein